jgi:hypothetical protein
VSVLRVYDPGECDERGVPLDWERCRLCNGEGKAFYRPRDASYDGEPCQDCGGHGSLKAAALAARPWATYFTGQEAGPHRCEDCGHPMSEGTWEHRSIKLAAGLMGASRPAPSAEEVYTTAMGHAITRARRGQEPESFGLWDATHWSHCDEGCRHGGPVRHAGLGGTDDVLAKGRTVEALIEFFGADKVQASWRPVDVRPLGWPHDLRPEKLAVLCLRCWSAR